MLLEVEDVKANQAVAEILWGQSHTMLAWHLVGC